MRAGEAKTLPTLGAGTTLTLARGLLTALLAGFAALPEPRGGLAWAPALLYLGVAVADFFDGYLARTRNHATKLGEELDVKFDALGVLVAVAVLVGFGRLPPSFLLVGSLYYLFHGHMRIRARRGRPVLPLQSNAYRRMYAGFLYGYLAVVLFPVLEPPWTVFGGYLFTAPVVAGFVADWLVMTGSVRPNSPDWALFEHRAVRLLYRTTPLVLRLALLPVGGWWLARGLNAETAWKVVLADLGWPAPMLAATLIAVAALAALGMTTAGWLGRLAALGLIALACLDVVLLGSPSAASYGLLAGSTGILLLGTGRGALWGPEDAYLLRKAGEGRLPAGAGRAAA